MDVRKKIVKTPTILQMEMVECGAASLAMILAYHGKWVPLEKVRVACGVSRDGSTAASLLQAARNYGCETKANQFSIDQLKERADLPCILHWNFNHFVVLNGFKGDFAVINDPAKGIQKVSMKDFDEAFTGICLEMVPGEAFVPGGRPASVWSFVMSRIESSKKALLMLMLVGALTALTSILTPLFSKIFIDYILIDGNTDWLMPLLSAMGALAFYTVILFSVKEILLEKIEGKLAIVSNADFLWHTLRLPMEFYAQRMAGDIMSRQTSNDTVADTLVSKLTPVLLHFLLILFYLMVMLKYSLLLTAIGIFMMITNLLMAQYTARKRIQITRTQMRDSGKLYATTVSGIEMIETIKASGAESGFFERWAGFYAAVNGSDIAFTKTEKILGSIPELLQQLSSVFILTMGAWMVMEGHFTVGMLLAFQSFMTQFLQPVGELISAGQSIQEMRTNMERIEDVMKYEVDVKEDVSRLSEIPEDAAKLSGQIQMENITFGYSKLSPPLVEGFSMSLAQGAKVAFVGSSGCGKSTLVKLLSGLYKPWSGTIQFDGQPIEDIPRDIFTASVAVVDQEIILFQDSISQNIKMWDESIEDFEVILAARDVQIHEDIMARENGYDTMLIEGGRNFSGGQRQRIEIARVLAQDPTIIILDEATSALDAKTEFQVMKAITDRNITCVVVAHRLSTIRDCDEIIVMDKGRIVERGTHEQLLQNEGLYTRLITTE